MALVPDTQCASSRAPTVAESHTDEPEGVHANVNKAIRASPLLSLVGALALFVASPPTVRAECFGIWPPFTTTVRGAQDVAIVRITESLREDPADNVIHFRLEVEQMLRGSRARIRDLTRLPATIPSHGCSAYLRGHVGDVFAIALNARVRGYDGQANSVALIEGNRARHPDMAEVPRLSRGDVRGLMSMPDTATAAFTEHAKLVPATLLVTLGSLALAIGLTRRIQRADPRG